MGSVHVVCVYLVLLVILIEVCVCISVRKRRVRKSRVTWKVNKITMMLGLLVRPLGRRPKLQSKDVSDGIILIFYKYIMLQTLRQLRSPTFVYS